MTIRESIYFVLDGIKSSDRGLINVSVSSGMQEEPFYSSREIIEKEIRGRSKRYFQEVKESPLEFNVNFAFEESWDDEKIREIARWLIQPYYKELYFSDNPNRRFYVIVVNESRLIHNSLKQGYVSLRFRCDSPHTYTPTYEEIYDFSSNTVEGTDFTFTNSGDELLLPELYIYKVGAGNVEIKNNSNGGKLFKIDNLADTETIYFDNEDEYIESDTGIYKYNDHNDTWLELVRGVNQLNIKGNCEIKIYYEFKLKQG